MLYFHYSKNCNQPQIFSKFSASLQFNLTWVWLLYSLHILNTHKYWTCIIPTEKKAKALYKNSTLVNRKNILYIKLQLKIPTINILGTWVWPAVFRTRYPSWFSQMPFLGRLKSGWEGVESRKGPLQKSSIYWRSFALQMIVCKLQYVFE